MDAYFDPQETLKGYYHVFSQLLITTGIPNIFYTNNQTVFEYKNEKMKDVGKETFTQFTYACKQLGTQELWITATSLNSVKSTTRLSIHKGYRFVTITEQRDWSTKHSMKSYSSLQMIIFMLWKKFQSMKEPP